MSKYKVQAGIEITGELTVDAESEDEARAKAIRQLKRAPFNGTEIVDTFANRCWKVSE